MGFGIMTHSNPIPVASGQAFVASLKFLWWDVNAWTATKHHSTHLDDLNLLFGGFYRLRAQSWSLIGRLHQSERSSDGLVGSREEWGWSRDIHLSMGGDEPIKTQGRCRKMSTKSWPTFSERNRVDVQNGSFFNYSFYDLWVLKMCL